MGIGEDIKSVLQELATPITIYKPNGTVITGEFIDYDMYYEHSTEFIRQNAYSGDFQFDTQATFGDVIEMNGIFCLLLNRKDTLFEQEVVIANAFLVQTNCLGKFSRKSEVRVNMEKTGIWVAIHDNVRGLQLDSARRPDLEVNNKLYVENPEPYLYTSQYADVRVGDRWYPDRTDPTECFRIVNINKRSFEKCLRLALTIDNRE